MAPKSCSQVSHVLQHHLDGFTYRRPQHPLVGLDPVLVRHAEEGDGAQDGCCDELNRAAYLISIHQDLGATQLLNVLTV
jgi:hypothetical protein